MRIAVLTETDEIETRVAATPETVKKYLGLGAEVTVEAGAGTNAGIPDAEFAAAGATVVPSAREALAGADIVLKVRRPAPAELDGAKPRRPRHCHHGPLRPGGGARRSRGDERRRLRDGIDAAHHPGAGDGRAFLAGEPRRLSRRRRRRRRIRQGLSDDDDRGRHRARRPRLRDGRRRRRPAGDRHRPPPRRRRHGDGRAPGREGAGRIPRREVRRRRGRGVQAGRDRRRLREADVGGVSNEAGRPRRRAYQEAGHRHHHGAHSRTAGAAARLAGDGRDR